MQLSGELAQRLLLACADLTRAATATAAGTRLSLTQARVLAHLDRHGPLRVSRLAELEHCAQPSMTGLLARLGDAGHVGRGPDPDDARAVLVVATPAGLAELTRHRALLREPLARALHRLDPATAAGLGHLVPLLEELAGSVRAGAPHPDPPEGAPCRPPTPA